MNPRSKNIVKYVLAGAVALVFVYFTCRGIDWNAFVMSIGKTKWSYLLLFTLATVAAFFFRGARWHMMLRQLDPGMRFTRVFDAANVGSLANVLLPGSGEFLRCALVTTPSAGYDKVFGTIVMERAWDVLATALMIVVALALKWDLLGSFFMDNVMSPVSGRSGLWVSIIAAVAVIGGALVLIYRFRNRNSVFGKIAGYMEGLWKGFISFRALPRKWLFLLHTLGIWWMYALMSYFILKAIPETSALGIADGLFVCALGNIASIIPVPGGIGAYHYILKLAMTSLYAVTDEIALLAATLNHELHTLLLLIAGGFCWTRLSVGKRSAISEK